VVDLENDNGSCLDFLTILESPVTALDWLSMGMHKHVLKTTLNVHFQNCATHRVVGGVRWWLKTNISAQCMLSIRVVCYSGTIFSDTSDCACP